MILIDTSVWIWYLANRIRQTDVLDRLLAVAEVAAHELVYGELLIGDRGGRRKFLADYRLLHRLPTLPHTEVVELVHSRKLHGRGIGWVDAHLLASALVSQVPLWTVDSRLHTVATELGVAYHF